MPDAIFLTHGVRALVCVPDGTKLGGDRDAAEIIGEALGHHADLVVIPVERLDDDFFMLSTGIAGQILQKFVTYGLRLAIVGDMTRYLADSSALRALVYESNRGRHVWFVADQTELDARLERAQRHGPSSA
jgi:hypothetical protein